MAIRQARKEFNVMRYCWKVEYHYHFTNHLRTGTEVYRSTETQLVAAGDSLESVADALYYSIDPYYTGLSGDIAAIDQVLKDFRIGKKTAIADLERDILIRLQSFLFFKLIRVGCQKNILDIVIRPRYFSESLGCELERFADLLDACGKYGYRSLGLALCLGNKEVFTEAVGVEQEYKQKILDALRLLEQDGISEVEGLRYFSSESSSLGGVIAGIAMNYILDEQKPLFSLARKDDELHVSARGNQVLVAQGLDLGGALKTVSTELGGHGGGHKIAAGATIAQDKEEEFLEKVNQILMGQLRGIV